MASPIIFVRAIETVCVSTQRAFERYGVAIGYSLVARLCSLSMVAFPIASHSVSAIMILTALVVTVALCLELGQLHRLLRSPIWPCFDVGIAKALFTFGIFCWIQAVSAVLFGQADRLITGLSIGAASVASYSLCAQLAQPVSGVVASGLHFLFPYISARSARDSLASLRRAVALAFGANLLLVAVAAAVLLFLGPRLLLLWSGPIAAASAKALLPVLVIGTAAQGMSVTGCYTLLALGRVRVVTLVNLGAGAALLCAAPWLLDRFEVMGVAMARLLAGFCTLLVYVPLAAMLFGGKKEPATSPSQVSACEEV
jgi:O-antigen/teichoic acid export membrane protein